MTYEDLANEKWKGRILVRSSSNSYNQALLSSIIANHGLDLALEWSKNVVQNFSRDPKGNLPHLSGDPEAVRPVQRSKQHQAALVEHLTLPSRLRGTYTPLAN